MAVNNLPAKEADIKRYANNFRNDIRRANGKSANSTLASNLTNVDLNGNEAESDDEKDNRESKSEEMKLQLDHDDDDDDDDEEF